MTSTGGRRRLVSSACQQRRAACPREKVRSERAGQQEKHSVSRRSVHKTSARVRLKRHHAGHERTLQAFKH